MTLERSPLEPSRPAPPPRFSNLQLRIITAVIALPILIAAIFAGGWYFAVAAGLVAAMAGLEFGHGWLFPRLPIVQVLPQLMFFVAPGVMAVGSHADGRFVLAGLVMAALAAAAGYVPTNALGPRKPWRVLAWAIVYVGVPLSAFVLLRDLEDGRDWFLIGLLSTFAVDTGADLPIAAEEPALTRPLQIRAPSAAHWVLVGSLLMDLHRVHETLRDDES